MAETNQTGKFQEVPDTPSDRLAPARRAEARIHPDDVEARRAGRWEDYDERRRRRTANLFFEDSIVLLGILLGGAAGYMAASTVRGSDWSRRSRQASGRGRQQPVFRPTEQVTAHQFC